MTITINERLNLVIPLENGKGFVHCPPLSRDAFALCWRLLARTWSSLESDDLGITAGAAVALMALKDVAEKGDETDRETCKTLMATIGRNASYVGLSEEGFDPVPLSTAIKRGLISDDDRAEVENALVFFIAASAILPKKRGSIILGLMSSLRAVVLSSLSATAYRDSLQKSTEAGNTGEMAVE